MKKRKYQLIKGALVTAMSISTVSGFAFNTSNVYAVEKEESYTKYVDPFVSTEVDYGQLFPGSVVPNALVKLSPDTYPHNTLDHAGYDYKKTQIQGFSHTRIEGVGGQGAGGDVLVTPTYVQYTARPKAETRAMKYEKSTEQAKPGYYKAELTPKTGTDNNVHDDLNMGKIRAEMTSDERTGYHRYTFPKAGNVNILADLNYTYHGTDIRNATLDVIDENETTTAIGGRFSGRNVGGSGKYTMYFYMETSKPAKEVKTWKDSKLTSRFSQEGNDIGAILNFDVQDNEAIELKVSISPISVAQAKKDMGHEISDWNFKAAYQRADQAWNDVLGKIRIETSKASDPTGELKQLFYTHLYHMFMTPMNATSTTGTFRGTDGKIHEAKDYTHYDSWTLWDDYRKYPMIGLVLPDVYKDMVKSIADALDYGIVTWSHDKQPVPNVRTEHAVALLADGVAKGFTDIDNLERAYEEAKKIANKVVKDDVHYVPGRVDQTVEYGYDDWALSLIAKALGKEDEAKYFLQRSFNYKNLFRKDAVDSPFSDGKLGLLWTKNADGSWRDGNPIKIGEHGLYQGSMWQYTWYDSNDVNGMMDLMGGKQQMLEALQYLFGEHDPDNGQAMLHNAANEVELHAPYLFNFAGRPDKTQYWVRQIYTGETWNTGYASGAVKEKMYKLSPQGYLETMDDDAGTMAMMFVSAAMGIFPMTPGDTTFQIGSPFFEKVSLDVGNGKTFTIEANHVSPENMYIQSATLNGVSMNRTWVDYSEITRGGTLSFEMGNKPSKWAQNGVPASSSSDNADTSTYDNDEIGYSTAMLEESQTNDGSINQKIEITLKSNEFKGEINDNLAATGQIKINNVPKGLTAKAIITAKNKVEIMFDGKAIKHKLNDSIGNLSIELTDQATIQIINNSIRKVKDNIKVMFSDDRLTYSSTQLKESVNDDGSIVGNATITLSGDSIFAGKVNEDLVSNGSVIFNNIPDGLTPKVIKTGDKTVVLSFEGKAKEHDYDVDFEISFNDKAFVGALASEIENSATGGMSALMLDFSYNRMTDLKKVITKAKLIQENVYTSQTYATLQESIVSGEKLLNKESVSDSELLKAIEKIEGALSELKLPSDAFKRLEGEKSDDWSGDGLLSESINLGGTYDGAWIKYAGLDFSDLKTTAMNIRYASNSGRCCNDGKIEIRLDKVDGELVDTISIPNTGSSWKDYQLISVELKNTDLLKGVHDVYFVLHGTTSDSRPFIANVDYLQFSEGLPQANNVRLEAEASDHWSGNSLKNEAINLGGTYDQAWITFDDVDFTNLNMNSLTVRYSTRTDKCALDSHIEIRRDNSQGELLGTVQMPQTTGWGDYQEASVNLNQTLNSKMNICFVLRGSTSDQRPYIANIDYMEFNKVAIKSHIEAEDRVEWSGGELKTEQSTDSQGQKLTNVGGTRNNSWLAYDNVQFDASGLTEMTVRYSHNPSSAGTNSRADIYLDSMDSQPIGTIQLPTTNGWANYKETSITFEKPISGMHKVYFVLHTDGGNKWVANFDWMEFEKVEKIEEVDKSELQKLYDQNLNTLKLSQRYEEIGFNHFKNAMNNAVDVLDNEKATDHDVKVAIKKIKNALPALQYKIIFELNDFIIDMEMIEEDGYTRDSYVKLQETIKNAQSLSVNSSYDQYKKAYDDLLVAHRQLTVLNKEVLKATVEKALNINLDLYTSYGKDEFINALKEAQKILNIKSLTQKEVDDVNERLDKAMSQLVAKANKNELEDIINKAENINIDKYTEDSIEKLNDALKTAKEVYSNTDATQQEVNDVAKLLQKAIDELKEKEVNPINPDNPDKPDGPNISVDTDDPVIGTDDVEKPNKDVETMDNTSIMFMGTMMILSGLACMTVLKRKREN